MLESADPVDREDFGNFIEPLQLVESVENFDKRALIVDCRSEKQRGVAYKNPDSIQTATIDEWLLNERLRFDHLLAYGELRSQIIFRNIHEYDLIVLMGDELAARDCEPFATGSKSRIVLDALTTTNNTQPSRRKPLLLRGGFPAWQNVFPMFVEEAESFSDAGFHEPPDREENAEARVGGQVEEQRDSRPMNTPAPPIPSADSRRGAQWKFHKEGRFNDLRLVVDGRVFEVSSLILATESEFFAEELRRSDRSELEIRGLRPEIATLLVEFAYRGDLVDFDAHAASLLPPAAACVRSLQQTFSLENAAERTILAVESGVLELREFVAEFFRRTPDFRLDFLLSARMSELMAADARLAVRVQQFVKESLESVS
ncbi:Kelch-like protein 29 isoform X1 [Aphelenchoides fujianensis]|nr:Kelch-like protein 29 isoform X1 [Aphelenchoides fujianensis]